MGDVEDTASISMTSDARKNLTAIDQKQLRGVDTMYSANQAGFFAEDRTATRTTPRLRATEQRREQSYPWLGLPAANLAYLADAADGSPTICADQPDANTDAVKVAPIQFENQTFLAMVTSVDRTPRVNGQPVPPFTVLRVRDQIQFNDRFVLHVSVLNRPYIGRPRDDEIGTECPFCRVPFATDTTVYMCPFCEKSMHCEGSEKPEQDRLECARLTTECSHCKQPVNMKEGYVYVPNI